MLRARGAGADLLARLVSAVALVGLSQEQGKATTTTTTTTTSTYTHTHRHAYIHTSMYKQVVPVASRGGLPAPRTLRKGPIGPIDIAVTCLDVLIGVSVS